MGRKGKVAYLYDGKQHAFTLDLFESSPQSAPGPPSSDGQHHSIRF